MFLRKFDQNAGTREQNGGGREGGKRLLHRLEKQTQGKDKVARKKVACVQTKLNSGTNQSLVIVCTQARKKAEIGRNRTQKIRKRYRRLNVKKLLSEINIDVLVCILIKRVKLW